MHPLMKAFIEFYAVLQDDTTEETTWRLELQKAVDWFRELKAQGPID